MLVARTYGMYSRKKKTRHIRALADHRVRKTDASGIGRYCAGRLEASQTLLHISLHLPTPTPEAHVILRPARLTPAA